jgi:hypothetical protein
MNISKDIDVVAKKISNPKVERTRGKTQENEGRC